MCGQCSEPPLTCLSTYFMSHQMISFPSIIVHFIITYTLYTTLKWKSKIQLKLLYIHFLSRFITFYDWWNHFNQVVWQTCCKAGIFEDNTCPSFKKKWTTLLYKSPKFGYFRKYCGYGSTVFVVVMVTFISLRLISFQRKTLLDVIR